MYKLNFYVFIKFIALEWKLNKREKNMNINMTCYSGEKNAKPEEILKY